MSVTNTNNLNVLIPMAGMGNRFLNEGYKLPKPLLPLGNKTMIESVVENFYNPHYNFIFIVNNKQIMPDVIKKMFPTSKIIEISEVPQGPAMSCMCAEELINNDSELIIINCDQIIEDFSYNSLMLFQKYNNADGILGVFHSASPKNSYIKTNDNNEIIEIREKQVISKVATNGFHYWKHGKYFVESVNKMVENKDVVNDEYYVAPSYNYMIRRGMKVMPFHFNLHYPIGIPSDYESYKKERNL